VTIDELPSLIGRKAFITDYFDISQTRIDAFGEATDDRQWIHVDPQRAATESPFGTTIAHGFLTLSLLPYMVGPAIDLEGVRLRVNYGLNAVRFIAPVKAGAKLRAHVSLRTWEPIKSGVQATWGIMLECRGSPLPACTAEWLVRYYR
jgi:acyl dehydratase